MAGKKALGFVKNLAFLLIGVALLYLAFRGQDFTQLMEDMRGANYLYVLFSILFGFAAYWSRGARWLILLKPMGYTPRLSNSVYSVIVGYFANLAIPRIGEVTRCTVMNQAEDIPVDKLFGTVILERIIDFLLLLTITFITILLKVDQFGGFFIDLLGSNKDKFPALVNLLVGLLVVIAIGLLLLFALRSRIRNIPLVQKIRSFFLGIREGITSIRKIQNRTAFFLHTFFIWFCYYCMTWTVFYSLEDTSSLGLIDGLFILVVGGFGMAAPVQGGIGAYHFIVSRGLTVLGVGAAPALSYATIVHTSQILSLLFIGSLAMGLLYLNNRKQKNNKAIAT